jgi:predicted metal-dependent hydrolase
VNETILVDELSFLVRRSARRKTVGLTVDRNLSLVAHLPANAEIEEVRKLILGKMVWVHQKLSAHKGSRKENVFRRPEIVDGEGFYYLGKHYRLKFVDIPPDGPPVPTVRFVGDRLLLGREQSGSGEARIAEYYTRAAHPFLNSSVTRWKSIVGVEPARYVQVMELGYKWGSCSANRTLNFHWRVMQLPPPVIDYVVVNELSHLKVPDHSPEFWREVRRVMADFELHRRWLRDKGGDL